MIKFARPKFNKTVIKKIKSVVDSGVFVHGPKTVEFEKKLSKFFKLKNNNILSTASCTASLHLFYLSIGLKKNDEVIMSAQTHVATAHAVEACGAKPVFVDCELKTGNIDITKIKKAINKNTRCICITHFLGRPTNMTEVLKFKKLRGIMIVEDTALSIGSKINKRFSGTFGDAGAFSFHPVKIITTGEGGAIIVKNKSLLNKIKSIKSFGYDIADPSKRKIPGNYNINNFGLNYRMNEIESTLGIEELKFIEKKIKIRKKNYLSLFNKIKDCRNFYILDSKSTKKIVSSYYALTIILNSKSKKYRDNIILSLKNNNIQTSIYYPHPVPLLNYYKKKYGKSPIDFQNSSRIAYNSISFPVAPHITKNDVSYMAKMIKKIIG